METKIVRPCLECGKPMALKTVRPDPHEPPERLLVCAQGHTETPPVDGKPYRRTGPGCRGCKGGTTCQTSMTGFSSILGCFTSTLLRRTPVAMALGGTTWDVELGPLLSSSWSVSAVNVTGG